MAFDSESRPARAAGSRLVFTDDGSRIESSAGGPALPISELGAIIWRSLDGTTAVGEIARDVAEARQSTVEEETLRIVEMLEELGVHRFLEEHDEEVDDEELASPHPAAPSAPDQIRREGPVGFDFIMDPYPMASSPAGRPTGLDILLATVPTDAGQRATLQSIAEQLRDAIGPDQTVWGMKLENTRPSWELYFYPHRSEADDTAATYFARAQEAFEKVVGWDAPRSVPSNAALFSFEFELEPRGVTRPRELDVYHRIEGDSDMILAYRHSDRLYRLKNTYELFPLPDHLDAVRHRLGSSRFAFPENEGVASAHWLGEIETAKECSRVWCSYKPDCDGIYLGRVAASDLARFLDRFAYPAHLRNWVHEHVHELDHLRYDLGFDYTISDGEVRTLKTGFYGYF
ncbi:MAG TPA: PqqD family protein [Acidimicrobiales bacterium]|nr:PqqD family protein [Acidimicrobiales bacterium]